MIIYYFNYVHILTLVAAALLVAGLYFALRNRSAFTKEVALYIIMGFNITQHFYKSLVWPHLWGTGFGLINTAYNVCAILIIVTPFVYVSKNCLLKQFVCYVGTIGPVLTLAFPYWFIGSTILKWEYWRSWTCHTLLIATSLLPATWGMIKFNWRDGWKFGLIFLAMLSFILSNDVMFLLTFGEATTQTLYDALLARDPLWMVSPNGAGIAKQIFEALSPDIFLETEVHPHIPILWYAVPMYAMVTIIGYTLGFILDRKRFWGSPKRLIKPLCRS